VGLVPFVPGRKSCRFADFSAHNQQLFMFSQTDAAEQAGVEFRPSVLPALRAGNFWFCPRAVNIESIRHFFSAASCS
jgi:hypothetical protein